jgi:predicted CDP-diglyceride synthetase/phosphatidate cytidylyltransferase
MPNRVVFMAQNILDVLFNNASIVCIAHDARPIIREPQQLVALVICLMGFFGGLVMCAIKRDRGVKDWGHMIEGHGGILDRLDSVVFAAPIFFHLVRYGWQ